MNPSMWRMPSTRSISLLFTVLVALSAIAILTTNYSNALLTWGEQLRAYTFRSGSLAPPFSPVVFAMIMIGEASAQEGVIAVKTALMHVSRPTEFHIVCSQDAIPVIAQKFQLFTRPAYDVQVILYPIQDSDIEGRAARSRVTITDKKVYGGMMKLWLHELLFDVEQAIYLDTDMMFLVDPYLLWRRFDNFAEGQLIHLPTAGPRSMPETMSNCIMLLKLEDMREHFFMDSTLFAPEMNALSLGNNFTWDAFGINPVAPPDLPDRSFYWAIFRQFTDLFEHLSEAWDVTRCHNFWEVRLDAGDENMSEYKQGKLSLDGKAYFRQIPEPYIQIFPGIIHYNCLENTPAWDNAEATESPSWGPYVTIAKQYKWVWLNRGDGRSSVTLTIKENVTFYDEILSRPPPQTLSE